MATLQGNGEREVYAGIALIAQVVHTVNLDDVYVLRVQPVGRPGLSKPEPVTAVLEAAIPAIVGFAHAKPVIPSEVSAETIVGNAAVGVFVLLAGLGFLRALFLRVFLLRFVLIFRP